MIFRRSCGRGGVPQERAGRGPEESGEGTSRPQKHDSRVGEVQHELKDAIKKCESLERKITDQESELAKAHQSAQEAGSKPRVPSGKSRRPSRLRRVRPLL